MTLREQAVKSDRHFPVEYHFRGYNGKTLHDIQYPWAYPPNSTWHTTYGNRYFNMILEQNHPVETLR